VESVGDSLEDGGVHASVVTKSEEARQETGVRGGVREALVAAQDEAAGGIGVDDEAGDSTLSGGVEPSGRALVFALELRGSEKIVTDGGAKNRAFVVKVRVAAVGEICDEKVRVGVVAVGDAKYGARRARDAAFGEVARNRTFGAAGTLRDNVNTRPG